MHENVVAAGGDEERKTDCCWCRRRGATGPADSPPRSLPIASSTLPFHPPNATDFALHLPLISRIGSVRERCVALPSGMKPAAVLLICFKTFRKPKSRNSLRSATRSETDSGPDTSALTSDKAAICGGGHGQQRISEQTCADGKAGK
jgi:hypothetical protein